MSPIVVIARKEGRLGNQLFQFAHFVAHAAAADGVVANPVFDDYADEFAGFSDDLYCRFPRRVSRLRPTRNRRRALYRATVMARRLALRAGAKGRIVGAIELEDDLECDLAGEEFSGATAARVLLVSGWLFRDYSAFAAHGDLIRELFAPSDAHRRNVERAIARARENCDVLVGVHVRRGDYRARLDGAYDFELERYRDVLSKVVDMVGGCRVRSLVCSDEPVELRRLRPLEAVAGPGSPIEDLYALARCDLIVGPPSTFGAWASFYGRVPRYELGAEAVDALSLDAFVVSGG